MIESDQNSEQSHNNRGRDQKQISLDILHHVESLSTKINSVMESRARNVSARYPITFVLLVLAGAIAVTEGLKGILEQIGLVGHPWFLLVVGLVVLIITGSVYKKL